MSACEPSDRLMQTLKVRVPGVIDEMLKLELFNVMDEFFRRTSAWRYEFDVELDVDNQEYPLALPVNTAVVRSLGATHNGLPVRSSGAPGSSQTSLGRLAPELVFPDGDATFEPEISDINAEGIFSYAIYTPDFISITTPPGEEAVKYPLKVAVALSVAKGCLECDCGDWAVPEWMWDMFFQDWLNGTLGSLYAMPAKPWTSPTLAVMFGKRFRSNMAFRKQEANKGFTYRTTTWKYPRRGGWI